MWQLTAYDLTSGEVVRDYVLVGMDRTIVKDLLQLDESDYPVECAEHPVSLSLVSKFAKYVEEDLVVDDANAYHVGLVAD